MHLEGGRGAKKLGILKREVRGLKFVLLLLARIVGFSFLVDPKAITSVLDWQRTGLSLKLISSLKRDWTFDHLPHGAKCFG